jgi:hypothetical protein
MKGRNTPRMGKMLVQNAPKAHIEPTIAFLLKDTSLTIYLSRVDVKTLGSKKWMRDDDPYRISQIYRTT